MKYLLDTCVVSDFVKGDVNTLQKIKRASPSELVISSITVMEVEYGLALNPKLKKTIGKIISDFFSTINILNYNSEDAIQSAELRAFLKKDGTPIGSYDILLAGTALNHKLILVSSNMKEFTRIKGLKIENWRTIS